MAWQPPSVTCASASSLRSYSYATPVPSALVGEDVIMGIDEAGRGPVIGPMVYGIAYYRASYGPDIRAAGFMDSKVLDHDTRVALTKRLCDLGDGKCPGEGGADELARNVGWAVRVMSAADISASMLHPRVPVNLNAQAFSATCMLIRAALDAGLRVQHVYVDTLGPPDAHRARLSREFPTCEFTVTKKADSIYPVVSVASVVAKVTRDYALGVLLAEVHAGCKPALGAGSGAGFGDGAPVKLEIDQVEAVVADLDVAEAADAQVANDEASPDIEYGPNATANRKRRRDDDTPSDVISNLSNSQSLAESQTQTESQADSLQTSTLSRADTSLTALSASTAASSGTNPGTDTGTNPGTGTDTGTNPGTGTDTVATSGLGGGDGEAQNWGSGYPSDPRTKSWLTAHRNAVFGWPQTSGVRYAWSTARDLLQPPGSATAARPNTRRKPNVPAGKEKKDKDKDKDAIVVISWHDELDADDDAATAAGGSGSAGVGRQGRISKYFSNNDGNDGNDDKEGAERADGRKFDVYKSYGRPLGIEAF